MLSTYLSYQLVTRDIAGSLDRVEAQPMVQRDTEYYLANIGKVKTVDEFVNDYRLFSYAMKAHGLGDMVYAKAFMVKALEEGVSDPDSFANKLTDKRYAEFVKAFNFADFGEGATTFNPAQQGVTQNYELQVELNATQPGIDHDKAETFNFLSMIGNVKSIDDLMADKRLLGYAMAAFGLDADMEPAQTVREMLEGGVSDPNSPANQLDDERYANFVSAFNFVEYGDQTTSRAAVLTQTPLAYLDNAGIKPFNGGSDAMQAEVDYFKANIGNVKSIIDLIGDERLLTFAMAAFGLDASEKSPVEIRDLLAGGVADPDSPANQLGDKRYAAFVRAFDFAQYGEATTSRDEVTQATPALYLESSDPDNAYYRANIGGVKSVDDLLSDERLLTYAMGAYGLDAASEPLERVRTMLQGGVSDPVSPANLSSDRRYAAFVAAFDFAQYGAATTARSEVVEQTPRYHIDNSDPETAYFRANIANVRSANGLMSDSRLLTYAMAAYGLDAAVEDPATVERMLTEGPGDPGDVDNLLLGAKYERYAAFAAAFDFAGYGSQTTSRQEILDATPTVYKTMKSLGLVKQPASYVQAETDHYLANVAKLTSIDDLMADERVLNYALSAFGLDPRAEDPARLRTLLEGGIRDPDSPANKLDDKRYAAFVAAFNFEQYGEEATTYVAAGQSTVDKYIRQTLEEKQGEQNEGVRLALYFQRKAPGLTNYYEILGDTALAEVARTALGLPPSLAQADVDKQADMLEERFDLADFKDPEKLNEFLERFTTMWEIGNPSAGSAQTSIAALFTQPPELGISTNLLLTMAQLGR